MGYKFNEMQFNNKKQQSIDTCYTTPWTNLKNIMFREMQKNTYCMVPYTQNYSPQKANLEGEKIVFFCNLRVNGPKGSLLGDGSILKVDYCDICATPLAS